MKAIILVTLGVLTAPALAQKQKPTVKAPAPATTITVLEKVAKPKLGESYELKRVDRRSKLPTESDDNVVIVAKGLSAGQVDQVAKDHHEDVDYCWNRLAILDRVPSTAVLKMSIDMTGAVTTVKIAGDAPAEVGTCLTAAAVHWTFPAAEARSEIQYPIQLRSL